MATSGTARAGASAPAAGSAGDGWLKVFDPRPEAKLRLFCFPYAGGGASVYRTWFTELPSAVEVVGVQPPGRESRFREEPFRHLEPMAQAAAGALDGQLDRPFAFFGHSMGAILAFEVTRTLHRSAGQLPLHLFVSGRPGPTVENDDPPIHELPREEFLEELRGYAGTPEEVLRNQELMDLLEPLLRADFSVSETYDYRPGGERVPVPITALGGTDDRDVPPDDLEPWRRETTGAFRAHVLEGGHFFLHERRGEVLRIVSRELEPHLAS
ncbi:MAG: thioesterase II family protein [Thermoanaerobaculia bacterium]